MGSLRDLLVLAVTFSTIPVALLYPFLGLLAFSWLAYMRPQDLAWGFASQYRLSYYVALATLVGMVLNKELKFFKKSPINVILILLWIWVSLSVVFALDPSRSMGTYIQFSKILLICFITTGLVNTRERLRWSILVIAFSFGFLGLKNGLFGLTHGGEVRFRSGVGGLIGDNNDFALALNMAIPFLVFLAKEEKNRYSKFLWIFFVPFTVATVIFTYSRGGFLALTASLGLCILKSKRKAWALIAAPIILYLFLLFAPATYMEHISTIFAQEDERDASVQGRLNAWREAIELSGKYPFLGVGVRNFLSVSEGSIVTHNSYLQILIDTGYPGLGIYLLLLGTTFLTLWKVRKLARIRNRKQEDRAWKPRDPLKPYGSNSLPDQPSDLSWMIHYSHMFEISLIAFLIGGTFLDRVYFDLTYHIMALTVCLQILACEHFLGTQQQEQNRIPYGRGVGKKLQPTEKVTV